MLFAFLFLAATLYATDATQTLASIREKVAARLAVVPNYTCTETIERRRTNDPCRGCEVRDRVRLEVLVIDKLERFAWPGSDRIGEKDIRDLVSSGLVARGEFWGFVRGVFVADGTRYSFAGQEKLEHRSTLRYDYEVPRDRSSFSIGEALNAVVGYRGSFWVDAGSLDLVRLKVEAVDIPPSTGARHSLSVTDFGPVRIGDSDFLLPQVSDLTMESSSGLVSRNVTRFVNCRQYYAASTIRFEDGTDAARPAASSDGAAVRSLPPGLAVHTALKEAVKPGEAAIGDPVTLVVTDAVQGNGRTWLEKGALLHGRISILEQHRRRRSYTVVQLDFSNFHARLTSAGRVSSHLVRGVSHGNRPALLLDDSFRLLPKGYVFDWVTE
jgi:hypothetical protein